MVAVFAVSLLIGGAFLVVSALRPPPSEKLDHPANPVSDDATAAQVVAPAKQIVSLAGLQTKSAGYLLMSCKNQNDPPYQGAIYLTFSLPAGARPDTYFKTIATTLVARGWTQGLPPNGHLFGETVSKDAVTAIIYPHGDDPGLGVLRTYGECRDINDHSKDPPGWIDITNQFPGP